MMATIWVSILVLNKKTTRWAHGNCNDHVYRPKTCEYLCSSPWLTAARGQPTEIPFRYSCPAHERGVFKTRNRLWRTISHKHEQKPLPHSLTSTVISSLSPCFAITPSYIGTLRIICASNWSNSYHQWHDFQDAIWSKSRTHRRNKMKRMSCSYTGLFK